MVNVIVVRCLVCGDKFICFMPAWQQHEHDGEKPSFEWVSGDIEIPEGVRV